METYYILIGVYMFLGLLSFEWAWQQVKPLREIDEQRDGKYPPFRRWDASKWRKWKFYFGAITFMPIRLIVGFMLVFLCYVFVKKFSIGHDYRNPVKGCRAFLITCTYTVISRGLMFLAGMRSVRKRVDFDYTPYLGPNYKDTCNPPLHVSTIVSNHASWLDVPILISHFRAAFASKKTFRKLPIFGLIVQALGCIFISRGASIEKRNKIVEQIGERQQIIEHLGEYPPICVFPEGGTTNGSYLMQFKRGAFASLRAVKPVVLKYIWSTLSPAWEVIPFMPLAIMQFSLFYVRCDVLELPTFVPNDYLFENHANKGTDRWEIYAWAVRDAMTRASDLEQSDMQFREKMQYEVILGFKKDRSIPSKKDIGATEKPEQEPLLNYKGEANTGV